MRISDWSSDVCSSDLRSPQAVDDLVAAQPGAPAAELLVDHVVLRSPTGCAGERRVDGPSGGAERAAEGDPLLVGRHRDGHPGVLLAVVVVGVGGEGEVLGRGGGGPVAVPDRKSVVWGMGGSERVEFG